MANALTRGLSILVLTSLLVAPAIVADELTEDHGQEEEAAESEQILEGLISSKIQMVNLLADMGRVDEAMKELRAALRIPGVDSRPEAREMLLTIYLEGAEMLTGKGKNREAEKLLKEGLEKVGQNRKLEAYMQMSLSNVYRDREDMPKALEYLQKANALFESLHKASLARKGSRRGRAR